MKTAKFVCTATVTDPVSKGEVEISIFKHPNGGMFGIDSSYIDQVIFEEDDLISDPFKSPMPLKDGLKLEGV